MKKNLNNRNDKASHVLPRAIIRTCLVICLMLTVSLAFGQMAAGKAKWVGNIWYGGSEPLKFSTYWNQLTPENAGKWDAVEGSRDVMNWSQVDAMYNYCKSKGYPFKQHCFVWGSQQPSWLGSLSAADQAAEVEEWIRLYGERYPDTDFIDVVNEMFHVTPVYKDALGGNGSTGWDWVVKAFQWARQYNPKAKLLINEYNVIEGWTPVADYVNLVNILKTRGLIDGIGVQNHGLETTSLTDVTNRLNQLGSGTGLPIYVSELDLVLSSESAQATRYSQLFPVLYENQYVAGITLWGYIEGHHWRDNAWILYANGTERPALTWIKNYLASAATEGPTVAPTAVPTQGPTPVPGTVSIACGSSSAVGNFQADQYYTGGTAYNNTNTVDVSQITTDTPPAALFNNERYGALSYTIPGFTSGNSYNVTLYFAETYLTSAGSRLFGVSINGTSVLSNFDIYSSAGGQNKAIARSFSATADGSGQIVIQLTAGTENPKINGISIQPGTGPTAVPTAVPTATPEPGSAIVFISPSNQTVNQGGTVTVEIHANTTSSIGAFGFTVTYPSNLLTFGSITEITSGLNLTNNTGTAGQIITAGFNANGIAGGSDVALIRITFTASSSTTGSGSIGLTVGTLADSSGTTISATANGGTVSVQQGANMGDVNDDGSITIVDALLIAQYYVGLTPSIFIEANADVNCSGSIDIVDALMVAQYYVGLISSFPC